MIVPVAPGGPTDLLARDMTPRLTEALGQQVIVDNRAGGNGNIGMEITSRGLHPRRSHVGVGDRGPPDGEPSIYKNLPFDPAAGLCPDLDLREPAKHPDHPSFAAGEDDQRPHQFGKSKPDYLIYATAGSGSPSHLAGED